jgi:ADP-ribose pyrophosphatase YjhB (NUDIX family)
MVIRPGVSAIILTGEGLLLQRRSDNNLWGLPGGGVEPGESVSEAIVREVREETGLDVRPMRLIGVYSAPALGQVVTYPDGNVIHYISSTFECRVVGGTLACDGNESLELGWFDPERLPAEMVPMHRVRVADALAKQIEAFVR